MCVCTHILETHRMETFACTALFSHHKLLQLPTWGCHCLCHCNCKRKHKEDYYYMNLVRSSRTIFDEILMFVQQVPAGFSSLRRAAPNTLGKRRRCKWKGFVLHLERINSIFVSLTWETLSPRIAHAGPGSGVSDRTWGSYSHSPSLWCTCVYKAAQLTITGGS